jgi:hypothetical protein
MGLSFASSGLAAVSTSSFFSGAVRRKQTFAMFIMDVGLSYMLTYYSHQKNALRTKKRKVA